MAKKRQKAQERKNNRLNRGTSPSSIEAIISQPVGRRRIVENAIENVQDESIESPESIKKHRRKLEL